MAIKIGDKVERWEDHKIGTIVDIDETPNILLKYRVDFEDADSPFWYYDNELKFLLQEKQEEGPKA